MRQIQILVLGRLAFCSEDCFTAALETELRPSPRRAHPEVAATVTCYGCGEFLAEMPITTTTT